MHGPGTGRTICDQRTYVRTSGFEGNWNYVRALATAASHPGRAPTSFGRVFSLDRPRLRESERAHHHVQKDNGKESSSLPRRTIRIHWPRTFRVKFRSMLRLKFCSLGRSSRCMLSGAKGDQRVLELSLGDGLWRSDSGLPVPRLQHSYDAVLVLIELYLTGGHQDRHHISRLERAMNGRRLQRRRLSCEGQGNSGPRNPWAASSDRSRVGSPAVVVWVSSRRDKRDRCLDRRVA